MYFATRSDLEGAPVLIWHVFSATARSAIVVSAVSPERWEEMAVYPALCAILLKPHDPDAKKKSTLASRFHASFNAAYGKVQNRYRNGYSSYLDVLDAQRTLFSVQTNVVQVKNNLLLAQIDLYRALGGGWKNA